jgi:ParB family chromosome partitioning protein
MRKSDKPYKGQANIDILFGGELEADDSPQTLLLEQIKLPSTQPRRYFDPQKLDQLTESIKVHGVLENLLVRPLPGRGDSYELVAGERRYRAATAAGLTEVPVTIRELTDEQALQVALIENLQREDLNPVEETEAILQLLSLELGIDLDEVARFLQRKLQEIKRYGSSHNDMGQGAESLDVSHNDMGQEMERVINVFEQLALMSWQSFTSNRLPLLRLPEDILEALRQGHLEYTKAKTIARIKNPEDRQELLQDAIENNLSVSQIRERVKALTAQPADEPSPKRQVQTITKRLNQAKLWEKDPKQWKKIQGWLEKIETLVDEAEQ